MRYVYAWYKWRNCTQSRLVLGKLYTIAVFLAYYETLINRKKNDVAAVGQLGILSVLKKRKTES
jgi:hypothetical protein